MIDLRSMALNLISKNPQIANNPRSMEMINVIKSGDSVKGEELARNLCSSYGVSEDQVLQDAKKFFNLF